MGGQKKHLVEVAKVYEEVLDESLELGEFFLSFFS